MFSKIFVPLLALKQKFMPDENCEWWAMKETMWGFPSSGVGARNEIR